MLAQASTDTHTITSTLELRTTPVGDLQPALFAVLYVCSCCHASRPWACITQQEELCVSSSCSGSQLSGVHNSTSKHKLKPSMGRHQL